MKTIIPLLFIACMANAQTSNYNIDTICHLDNCALQFRIKKEVKDKIMVKELNNKSGTCCMCLIPVLEDEMDRLNGAMIANDQISDLWLRRVAQSMEHMSGIGCDKYLPYKEELAIYKKYTLYKADQKEANKRIADSLERAKDVAHKNYLIKKQQIADSIAMAKNIEYLRQYAIDSINRVEFEKQELARLRKKYGPTIAYKIMAGRIDLGFTKAMCIEALGEPSNRSKTSTKKGVIEIWLYNLAQTITFLNGTVISFTEKVWDEVK